MHSEPNSLSSIPIVTQTPDTNEFIKGLWDQNPIFVQALGLCPTLAVTNTCMNALTMGLATLFVLICSSVLVATLRLYIPKQVRIACFILIIATFVTAVDYIIQAISIELHKTLGAFISLIVVNCLILGRAEAFASKNTVSRSFFDAAGMGLGFLVGLLCLGVFREVLGNGSIFSMAIFPAGYEKWLIMMLPGGGFFALGLWVLLVNWLNQKRVLSRKPAASGGEA